METRMKTTFTVLGMDPDTKATGLAIVTGTLPPREVTPQEIEVLAVNVAEAKGMDARRRLPDMARSLLGPVEEFLDEAYVDAVVVEAQAHRKGDPRPDNIVQLAVVEGMAVSTAYVMSKLQICPGFPCLEIFLPLPVDWKGNSESKAEHQVRLLKRLHLKSDLAGVEGAEDMKPAHRIHVVDAIGLAVWGLEQLVFEERKMRILR